MFTVYTITQDGVVRYVGKTKDFTRRKWIHINCRGASNSAIPTDINLSTIEFHPIALYTDEVQALKFEDWMIHKYDTINNGWNKNKSGYIWTDDVNAYNRVYQQTPEYKAYQKVYQKAYQQTPKYKAWKKAYEHQRYLRKKHEKNIVIN